MKISNWLPARGTESLANLFGVVRQRLWSEPGKAHIELPDLDDQEYVDFTAALKESLESHSGIYWATANGALSRMIVAWDEDICDLESILEITRSVEKRFHVIDGPFSEDRIDHPGDDEAITRQLARIGADVLGASAGVMMKVFRRTPGRGRVDLAALMAVVDNVPHIRQALTRRIGKSATDTGIGLTNPLIQGWGSGPIGPIVDLGYQACKLREDVARRESWNRREPDLCSRPERAAAPRAKKKSRPVPVPEGPIEHYAGDAWNISLGGFMVGLADTQDLQRAITPLLDALPKPARFGRGSFSASLGVVLSERDLVIMNKEVLRTLDRIDVVIVDDTLLITDEYSLDRIATADDDVDAVDAYQRAEEMLDSSAPDELQTHNEWSLGPAQDFELTNEWREQLNSIKTKGDLLALTQHDEIVALFSLRSITNPASKALIEAIREAELELIIATDTPDRLATFHPDRTVETGEKVEHFIRHIQRDFQVVAFLCDGPHTALDAADCSMGFTIRSRELPWTADIIANDNLDDATFLIKSISSASEVSQQSATLAGAGAGIGAFSAIRGLEKTHPGRVMLAVNAASIIALLYGTSKGVALGRQISTTPASPIPWHRFRVEDVLKKLHTSEEGLSESEAEKRDSPPEEPLSTSHRLGRAVLQELSNPLTPVLAAGAAVSAVVGSMMDASIVGAVIAINGLIGGMERFNSEAAMEKMARRDITNVRTLRDGTTREVTEEELVCGDIIELTPGDVVPADCRILTCDRLEVDESSLTGESLPVSKSSAPSFSPIAAERSSMLYEGTAIATGEARAVVVATGHETEAQQAYAISSTTSRPHGVEARLSSLTDMSLPFASLSGGILMSLGILRRQKLQDLVGPGVNLAVSAVPEGLPLLATTAQLAASRRLSDRNMLVNNPRVMEALGRTDLLCIDKTGTLTEGTLTLHSIFNGEVALGPKDYGEYHHEVLRAALRATPPPPEEGELHHATDRAIIDGARNIDIQRGAWTEDRELPFKSELAFHAIIGDLDGEHKMSVKGSPEAVLSRCSRQRRDGKSKPLSNTRREALKEISHDLAGQGLRILAVAERNFDAPEDEEHLQPEDVSGLTFFGFVALSDPLRPTSKQAVKALRAAGVSVMMLTGDHPHTARRIAADAGLISSNGVLSGHDIDAMSDQELSAVLVDTHVIARTTPAHKVRIVEALQTAGRVVAMTGDGANDAAAIRLADVGIALGDDSSRTARDAADLVVTDSRLETIVDAVVEGRGMWRSVRDAVSILIGGNLGEVGFMLASGVTSTTPALNSRQLLMVNLFTDVAPALAIAIRPPPQVSPDQLLHEGPEESLGKPLERDILWRAAITGTSAYIAWFLARHTFQKTTASTVGLLTVVTSQLGQTLTTAKPTAPVWAASLGSLAVLLAIIETPGLSQALGCKPLGPMGLSTALLSSAGATLASAIIPELPAWRRRILHALPQRVEPEVQDFLDEFFEATSHFSTR